MPTKHVIKAYVAPAFYHVYNRASGERLLFYDAEDRLYFLSLLRRHLVPNSDPHAEVFTIFEAELVAYCLMGTHYHLLLYQENDPDALQGLMRSLGTAYAMYYNKKYTSKGHVFQSSYRASLITNEPYLAHITRYIHRNPRTYETYAWSSYGHYVGQKSDVLVHPGRVLDMTADRYKAFVADYGKDTVSRQAVASQLASPF